MLKRSHLIVLLCCGLFSAFVIATLYALSPLDDEILKGGFDRNFTIINSVNQKAVTDLEYNSFYIAGVDGNKVYLGNSTAPFHVAIIDKEMNDSSHVMLKVHLDSITETRRFKLVVEPPNFYLMHGTAPQILKGSTHTWKAYPIMKDSEYYFVEAVPTGKTTFALRSYNENKKEYSLARKTKTQFEFKDSLLQKQLDGVFCVDGQLNYSSSKTNTLAYVYFYRNQFLVTDSVLNLKYRGNTIDTFSRAKLKVAHIEKSGTQMLARPPFQINRLSCISDNNLYIQSGVLANNEDPQTFMTGSTIDVYSIKNGNYLGSFHVPNHNGFKLSSFRISDRTLFGIFDQYLIKYDLDVRITNL